MSVNCEYFASGQCRSCALIETSYDVQLRNKQLRCQEMLPSITAAAWLPPVRSAERGFRNKAKLVVGGASDRVTLGILGPDGLGVDLRDCLIHSSGIRRAIPKLAEFLEGTGLAPYNVPQRSGELKFVHVTEAPDGALMVRFVVRSEFALERLRNWLDELLRLVPSAAVVSVNLLPEHRAVLEGEREELLLGTSLPMHLGDIALHLQPQSFFQTNTAVARALYAQAAEWVERSDAVSLWDLYCGVGGFALHCASGDPARDVLGVELSEAAVQSARRSAREAGIRARFEVADATEFALGAGGVAGVPGALGAAGAAGAAIPELVIVNPPRRGIGEQLAGWLERGGGVREVIYSSCNPESLARDLAAMPAYEVREARVFDMFPHTTHLEVAVLLQRRAAATARNPEPNAQNSARMDQ